MSTLNIHTATLLWNYIARYNETRISIYYSRMTDPLDFHRSKGYLPTTLNRVGTNITINNGRKREKNQKSRDSIMYVPIQNEETHRRHTTRSMDKE